MKLIDLSGKKVNMLTIIKRLPNKNKRTYWLCKCECGNFRETLGQNLLKKDIYSCGCTKKPIHQRKTKYGIFNKKIYSTWNAMKHRCYSKEDKEYKHYGNRGIKICDEWNNDFMSFYNWAINNGYKDGLTIDRINNDGNYEPNNCRWISRRENNLNRRGIILINYNNSKMCLKDYCKLKNICYDTALRKHKRGINIWE